MRARGMLRFAAALQAFLLLASLFLPGLAAAATIQTDLWVYQTGDTVNVTGAGFGDTEAVDFVTTDPTGLTVDSGASTSDASGNVAYSFVLNASVDGLYTVVAAGETTGDTASTQFDPTNVTLTSPASFSWNPASLAVGGKYSCQSGGTACDTANDVTVGLFPSDGGNNHTVSGTAVATKVFSVSATGSNISWSGSISFPGDAAIPSDGLYDIRATFHGHNGASAVSAAAIADNIVGFDYTAPTSAISTIVPSSHVTVTGTSADATSLVSSVLVQLYSGACGSPGLIDTASATTSLDNWSVNLAGSWADTAGSYCVRSTATDNAGNTQSPSAEQTFTVSLAPTVISTTPTTSATGVGLNASVSVNFSEAVTVTTSPTWLTLSCGTSGLHGGTTSGSGTSSVTFTPTSAFVNGELCTATVKHNQVTAPDGITTMTTPDYSWTFTTVSGTVVLTVTASSPTGVYGDPVPTITPSYSGFTGGDTASGLTTQPTCGVPSYTHIAANVPGNYTTSCSGGVSSKYTFNYVNGSFVVGQKSVTITASSPTGVYGDPVPTITPSYGTFAYADTSSVLTTAPTCGVPTYSQYDAPSTYPTSCSGAAAANYTFNYVNGSFAVGQATLSITASSPSGVVYGDPVPSIGATYVGFVGSDGPADLSGSQSCGTTYTQDAASVPGTYPTSCSGFTSTNYDITYVDGSFDVLPAPLTITADDKNMILHGASPTFTVSFSGFVYGQSSADLNGSLACVTTATSSSPIGAYPITCSGYTSTNYSITWVSGTLHVIYNFAGFLQPVNDTAHSTGLHATCGTPCPISVFKGGSTIPFKFVLMDANGNIVQPSTAPIWVSPVKEGPVTSPVDDSVFGTVTATTGGSYLWDGSQWHYNWNTSKNQAGYYWLVGAMLDDGTTQWVWIGLK